MDKINVPLINFYQWFTENAPLLKPGLEIVLVEDNEDEARKMMHFLRQNVSNNVRWIQDGAAAAEFLLFQTDAVPRLVLLDLILPSMDGIDLFRLIKAEPAERMITVNFMITSAESKKYIESLGLDPDGFIEKPKVNSSSL
jgi:two-component system, response regulator